jgi:hypothetical protein
MVLLISCPQALLAVGDCFFSLKDLASINTVKHIVAGTTMMAHNRESRNNWKGNDHSVE